jgi:hypothetical protein
MQTSLELDELEHNFLCFCSFVCIINGKKLNLPNIFLAVIRNPIYKMILCKMLSIDNDFGLFKFFITYDPSLAKSKYISKFLNSKEGIKIRQNVYHQTKESIQQPSCRIKKSKRKAVSDKKGLLEVKTGT